MVITTISEIKISASLLATDRCAQRRYHKPELDVSMDRGIRIIVCVFINTCPVYTEIMH